MDISQKKFEDKKLLEGRLTFDTDEKGFERNSVLGIYRFLKKHEGQAWEYVKENERAAELDRKRFLDHHTKPDLWNLGYTFKNGEIEISPRESKDSLLHGAESQDSGNMFASIAHMLDGETYDPESQESNLKDHPDPTIHWTFNEPGPHYLNNVNWFRYSDRKNVLSFVAAERDMEAYRKLMWLTRTLCDHYRAEGKKVEGVVAIENEIQNRF